MNAQHAGGQSGDQRAGHVATHGNNRGSAGRGSGGNGVTRRTAVGIGAAAVVVAGVAGVRHLAGCGRGSSRDSSASGPAATKDHSTSGGSAGSFEKSVSKKVKSLSLEQKVAQMFFPRPEVLTGIGQVVAAGETTLDALKKCPVGGMCYFGPNLQDSDQTTQMLQTVNKYSQEVVGLPIFMSVDEEGGTVSRIGGTRGFGIDNVGNMCDIGATGDTRQAYDVCAKIAGYLKPLGFNLDFAPDADIVNGTSQTMAKRSFGSSADVVAPMVESAVKGFMESDLYCCAKHFPGIGGAEGDSETEAITTEKTLEQMRQEELRPFQSAIEAGVPMIMVGHISCPSVTGDNTPASLSKTIVTDVLRKELGFDGIIITDSLGMGAVDGLYSAADLGVAAIQAGVDMLLMTPDLKASYQGVLDAIKAGTITEDRIDESATRIVRAKLKMSS